MVGAYRALQNPDLCQPIVCLADLLYRFTHQHYRQALYAVAAGLTLYLLLLFPLFLIRASVWASSLFMDRNKTRWDDDLIDAGFYAP